MKYALIVLLLLCMGCSGSYQAKELTIVTFANDTISCTDCIYTWDTYNGKIYVLSARVRYEVPVAGIYSIDIKHD